MRERPEIPVDVNDRVVEDPDQQRSHPTEKFSHRSDLPLTRTFGTTAPP
ncbi:unannotated protein [freshwater metagenome]|uniref:Unannotated protein n=1 Tax=freshwater metagenome TaxID=449393 RepID=A0A6J7DRY7_9ZZZZ|nr:hypothetical protein [Actinomycetota bacterium]